MSTFEEESRILITCPKRLPQYLRVELESLGYPIDAELVTGIETHGTPVDAMRLNLHVRTGHRVLYLLDEFPARTPNDLYERVWEIEWERWISPDGYLSVTSSVDNPTIRDTQFANVRCKDAIVDRFRAKFGRRPDSGSERSGVVVFLHWKDDACAIYLDTSGESLSRRGYRKIAWKAPMQESLAAAVVMATGWSGEENFVNPMCGSGTLAIEAVLIALDRPPGLLRADFAFTHLRDFDENLFKELRREARASSRKGIEGKIIATDISPDAVIAARKNATTAGVDHLIEFGVCDFADTPVPEGGGAVVLNPEYGERLGRARELEYTYAAIGDFFKKECAGYRGYIFTGNLELAKRIGLRTKRRIPFYNTTIDCRLLEYELYEGSRRREGESG